MSELNTLQRIKQLDQRGLIDNATALSAAYSHIIFLLLRQQLVDHSAGTAINNYLPPEAMSGTERADLVDALRCIRRFCQQVEKRVKKNPEFIS